MKAYFNNSPFKPHFLFSLFRVFKYDGQAHRLV